MKKIIILILVIFSLSMISGAGKPLTVDDIFQDLLSNDANGEAIFTINNPKDINLPIELINFNFNEVCGHVNQLYIYKNVTITNGTNISSQWQELTEITKGKYTYKINADIQDEKCNDGAYGHKIDWIPTITIDGINFTANKWAWWNNTVMVNTNCTINDWIGLDNGSSTVGYDTSGSIRPRFPNEDNTISFWDMNNNSNDQMCRNDGTNNGATFQSNIKLDGGYLFDGSNDYINIATSSSLNPSLISIVTWLNTTVSSATRVISHKGDANVVNGYYMDIRSVDVNRIRCQVGHSSWSPLVVDNFHTINTWHHVVCTYDGTNTTLYVDGVFAGSKVLGNNGPGGSSNPLRIASRSDVVAQHFGGQISYVKIYNFTLSATQVNDSYNNDIGKIYNSSGDKFFSISNNTGNFNRVNITLNNTGNVHVEVRNENGVTGWFNESTNNVVIASGQNASFQINLTDVNATFGSRVSNFAGITFVGDTCLESNVTCSDNCTIIVSDTHTTLRLSGTGTYTILANVTVDRLERDKNCILINKKNDGNWLAIQKG